MSFENQEPLLTDVCIVGAGPAGAATSIRLSQLKIPHTIIDKAVFPRDKTCGDGLILYAYKALKTLDEDLFQAFLEHPKILHSKSIKLHINNDHYINFKETEDRDSIISYAKRIDFDNFLVENLNKKYANTIFGDEVKKIIHTENGVAITLKSGQSIQSKLVVGADGIQSVVSRKLAKNKIPKDQMSTFINAYYSGADILSEDLEAEIRVHYQKMPLFFYVFPLSDGMVNVSLGGNASDIQKHNINLKEELETILARHPKVKDRFVNSKREGNWRGWGIPYHFFNQKVSGNCFLLVGDAAGLANAFYKEGVGTGMMSGIICANKVKECLDQNDFSESFLKDYKLRLDNEFGKLLKFSKRSLRLAYRRKIFSFFTKLFKPYVERKTPELVKKRSY
ncbi:MAG: hypothetical protein CMB99_04130 [Flavobacteriaceae bacterium]|nr:hypothetical protein [Flavobacteriaceae bacterium]|tara:strand:- start:17529 stop:18710 length:1182 start_codon:yes stop_codon:yes gene_type:complete